jgi:hypothetical protein
MELVTQLNQTLDQRETELRRIQASERKDAEDDLDNKTNLSKSC